MRYMGSTFCKEREKNHELVSDEHYEGNEKGKEDVAVAMDELRVSM